MKLLPLTKLEANQSGTIKEIQGGKRMIARLNALGVIPGKKVTKINTMMMHGPVVFKVNSTVIALGFGQASRIIVEIK
jgi:Fe2+ transport system protein FeoA